MITNIVVLVSIVFAGGFSAAWLMRPGLRAWIERPKYGFLGNVKNYDRIRGARS